MKPQVRNLNLEENVLRYFTVVKGSILLFNTIIEPLMTVQLIALNNKYKSRISWHGLHFIAESAVVMC